MAPPVSTSPSSKAIPTWMAVLTVAFLSAALDGCGPPAEVTRAVSVPGSAPEQIRMSQEEADVVDGMTRKEPGSGRSRASNEEVCGYWQKRASEIPPGMTGAVKYAERRGNGFCSLAERERERRAGHNFFDHCLISGKGVDQEVSCLDPQDGQMRSLSQAQWEALSRQGKPGASLGCHADRWDADALVCVQKPSTAAAPPATGTGSGRKRTSPADCATYCTPTSEPCFTRALRETGRTQSEVTESCEALSGIMLSCAFIKVACKDCGPEGSRGFDASNAINPVPTSCQAPR
jgi:hypothetical protein